MTPPPSPAVIPFSLAPARTSPALSGKRDTSHTALRATAGSRRGRGSRGGSRGFRCFEGGNWEGEGEREGSRGTPVCGRVVSGDHAQLRELHAHGDRPGIEGFIKFFRRLFDMKENPELV